MARLEHTVFADRAAMLKAWRSAEQRLNDAPFQKLAGSRSSRFLEIERPALKPLPATLFRINTILTQTVPATGVVYIPADKTSYSVPNSLLNKQVEILISPQTIEVWYEHERYTTHNRTPHAGKVVLLEHLLPAKAWYAGRNPDEALRALNSTGPHVASVAQRLFDTAGHQDIAWKRLEGLKRLVQRHPDRIDRVCRMALSQNETTLTSLKHILESDADLVLAQAEAQTAELGFHENIRGASYYGQRVQA